MQYNLYTTTGRTTVWRNAAGSWQSGTGAGMGTANPLTVYGRVAAGQQNLAVGNFSDTITVTWLSEVISTWPRTPSGPSSSVNSPALGGWLPAARSGGGFTQR
jgi:hypothetical protein